MALGTIHPPHHLAERRKARGGAPADILAALATYAAQAAVAVILNERAGPLSGQRHQRLVKCQGRQPHLRSFIIRQEDDFLGSCIVKAAGTR